MLPIIFEGVNVLPLPIFVVNAGSEYQFIWLPGGVEIKELIGNGLFAVALFVSPSKAFIPENVHCFQELCF